MQKWTVILLSMAICSSLAVPCTAQKLTREEKLKQDRAKVEAAGQWIYNDLELGFRQARETNKPLLVVLRCVPCEECVKLDDDLMDTDPAIGPLLQEFVRVRQVSTNGLDLKTFQFDTDQSFAVFFLNADGTVYGRFGTRSHRTEWIGDVSLEGMAEAMRGALELHRQYPANRGVLEGKQGGEPEALSPEQFPALQEKYDSRWKGGSELVKSCIHCHQIGDAQRQFYWESNQPVPTEVIFQYPHPKSIGIVFDPKQRAVVKEVLTGTAAAAAGIQAGDTLVSLQGQPLLSIADVQWVLHRTGPAVKQLSFVAERGGETINGSLSLPADWRVADDISWRASSWGLRRMVLGGLVLQSLEPSERKELGLTSSFMALRVKHVGQYGDHAAAKNAGIEQGDVLISYDGRTDLLTESQLLAYALQKQRIGQRVQLKVQRGVQQLSFELPVQR